MKEIKRTNRFNKEIELMSKRGKSLDKLKAAVYLLSKGEKLPAKLKDHPLKGDKKGLRDLHIEPDWLLFYRIEGNFMILEATETHSDLFD